MRYIQSASLKKMKCYAYTTYVTGFGKACNNAIEHVFMYKLIKINISIDMYTEVIFKHPYLCNRKEHGFGLSIIGFYGASPFI